MEMDALYTQYFQKSKIFLYPLLGIKRGSSVTPFQTYFEWEGHYAAEDMKLIAIYPIRDDQDYKLFMKNVIIKHPRLTEMYKIDEHKQVLVFDFSDMKDDWSRLINGQYSKIDLNIKRKIRDHFDKKSSNFAYIESYLFPERYFNMYAKLLGVDEHLLRTVGELCTKPDLEKEKLTQEIIELHITKILD